MSTNQIEKIYKRLWESTRHSRAVEGVRCDICWRAATIEARNKCPQCGGPADNGHDRCYPPNPYYCSKCESLSERCC